MLNCKRKFFLSIAKNRLPDPSEIGILDFKGRFRQCEIRPVSATIGFDWSIIEVFRETGATNHRLKKTVSR